MQKLPQNISKYLNFLKHALVEVMEWYQLAAAYIFISSLARQLEDL